MRFWRPRPVLAGICGLLAAVPLIGQAPRSASQGEVQIESVRDSRKLAPGIERLEIRNLHGDVRIRAGALPELELSAILQRSPLDSVRPEIAYVESAESLAIEVRYPTPSGQNGETSDTQSIRRVDLTVLVPLGHAVEVVTDSGLIEARGLADLLAAETTTGDIRVRTRGPIRARSEHGRIELAIQGAQWPATSADKAVPAGELVTVTGDIEVWLPWIVALRIEAATRAYFRTNLSLEVTQESPTAIARASAELSTGRSLGQNSAFLRVRSEKGTIGLFHSANE